MMITANPRQRPLYEALASTLLARENSRSRDHATWFERHTETLTRLVKDHLPSGSGFDAGTTLNLDKSRPERLVFDTSYHHMDEHGGYNGWSEHSVVVTPSLWANFHIAVTGQNRNDVKEYIAEMFETALRTTVEY